MNTISDKKTLKPYAELKQIWDGLHFSIGEMAAVLGIPKSTYQGYEENRRTMPNDLISKAIEWREKDLEFMRGIAARIDARLADDGFSGRF